ncbi:MAG: sensor histidine kinase [Desulfovibrionales bacterium]|nr:sensor histidine kinase [Desulfovibrionales bacterium]
MDIKSLLYKFKPRFWDEANQANLPEIFSYRRIWKMTVFCLFFISITPLLLLALMEHNLNKKAIQAEVSYPVLRLVSNTALSVGTFLQEKKSLLNFIVESNNFHDLTDSKHLEELLSDINNSFGGFADLGVIDSNGIQVSYTGPFDFMGKNYSQQEWFTEVVEKDVYISEVFRGYRDEPHFIIALKKYLSSGNWFILRTTIDTEKFNDLIQSLNVRASTDVFLVNQEGILQTCSVSHRSVLEKIDLNLPELGPSPSIQKISDSSGVQKFLGYAKIDQTPFIIMIVKDQKELMENWWKMRMELLGFMIISITSILLVILSVATYLVSRIYESDLKRTSAQHKIEHTNKMASIGRLAAGVAHEINNPLAIINEKAGLLKDLFTYSSTYSKDDKLNKIADSIISSVQRCSAITRRLLGFARHVDVVWQKVRIDEVIRDVLEFLNKEALYKGIAINFEVKGTPPELVSDQGQLEQVFLNIINNAFAAINDEQGKIRVLVSSDEDHIRVKVTDSGCGISEENLKRIFEPFFTTKHEQGTGLGLSITYGLVKKLGGEIHVESEQGKGTSFTVVLPKDFNPENSDRKECTP